MLKIKNWSIYQHYKDRNPPWIKLHTDIFQNYKFSKLSDASKLLAICYMTLAARSKTGEIPCDIEWVKSQCGLGNNITINNTKELIDIDFIEDASNLLASCKQNASLEREREREGEKKEKINKKEKSKIQKPEDVSDQTWEDFITHRKAKKAPITATVIDQIQREAIKAGTTIDEAIKEMVSRNWQGFKAEWYKNPENTKKDAAAQAIQLVEVVDKNGNVLKVLSEKPFDASTPFYEIQNKFKDSYDRKNGEMLKVRVKT
jgi:hypothetical protein